MSERTNKATSGQNVPKSPKSKFRAKSQQEQTAEHYARNRGAVEHYFDTVGAHITAAAD